MYYVLIFNCFRIVFKVSTPFILVIKIKTEQVVSLETTCSVFIHSLLK